VNQALERQGFAQIATDSVSAAVRGLKTPTLIVWGADDYLRFRAQIAPAVAP
jgi:pimeloyl-ACP methyl ester carboxylesterase